MSISARFRASDEPDSGVELRTPAAQHAPAARAVERRVGFLGQRVIERSAALALRLERLVAARDAEVVVDVVSAEAAADGAAFGNGHFWARSQVAGSTAGVPEDPAICRRISKCRCE